MTSPFVNHWRSLPAFCEILSVTKRFWSRRPVAALLRGDVSKKLEHFRFYDCRI